MPSAENFAGNQDNWGASANDNWGVTATGAAGTGAPATNEWNASSNAANTGVSTNW